MESRFCIFVFIVLWAINIKLDLLIGMTFVLVKIIELDLYVNYYFEIVDLD